MRGLDAIIIININKNVIGGNKISVKALDFSRRFDEIRAQIENIAESLKGVA